MQAGDTVRGGDKAAVWGGAIAVAIAFLPFLLVTIPPLPDAPGHLAQLAIQTAPPDSPLHRFFGFHWGLRLNLGVDLLVEGLRPFLGLERAFWLVTASIPPLTVLAILCLARTANRGRTAAAASWALPFAYAYPFTFGFLNYALAMALSLLGFALWVALEDRRGLRSILFWAIMPAAIVAHAIGGLLLPLMIFAAALPRLHHQKPADSVRALNPLLAAVLIILVWKIGDKGGGLDTVYDPVAKLNAVALVLRDQNRLLDLLSLGLILIVPVAGRLLGARFSPANAAVVAALALLFVIAPNELNGSSYTDTRIVPALAIAALALQDWSAVPRRWRTIVALSGMLLFAVRMTVTTNAFAAYARSYAAERAALDHVAPGSRVLALVTRQCRSSRVWRMDRLDHLPALAVVDRASWTNVLWEVPGVHLMDVRYRPSPDFYDDPSHYVWPADCVAGQPAPRTEEERRNVRRTIEQTAPMLPIDRVDYLWLINARLPAGFSQDRLMPVWSSGHSFLYRVKRVRPPSPHGS